ncbi:uncharacterized protein [Eurosta solidaginis]|uniref:uncharacterized protein n=1 Tax=Eurosta solidaginis TaxID=178769 RepID=UPI00353064D8
MPWRTFFYKIRASQGINMHPSANEMQYIVARLMSMKILRHHFEAKGSNCADDDDIFLDWNHSTDVEIAAPAEEVDAKECSFAKSLDGILHEIAKENMEEEVPQTINASKEQFKFVQHDHTYCSKPEMDSIEDIDFMEEARPQGANAEVQEEGSADETLLGGADPKKVIRPEIEVARVAQRAAEIQVQRYYSGYSLYQTSQKKVKCDKCEDIMRKSTVEERNSSEALIRAKNYKPYEDLRLVNPSDYFFQISADHMRWYIDTYIPCLRTRAFTEENDHRVY